MDRCDGNQVCCLLEDDEAAAARGRKEKGPKGCETIEIQRMTISRALDPRLSGLKPLISGLRRRLQSATDHTAGRAVA
jgi:hypothetical protein